MHEVNVGKYLMLMHFMTSFVIYKNNKKNFLRSFGQLINQQ